AVTFFGPMTMAEFLPTRVLEAVVHGHDASEAVGRPPHMTPTAKMMTVGLLEELLARRAQLLFPAALRAEGARRPRTCPTILPSSRLPRVAAPTPTRASRSCSKPPRGGAVSGLGLRSRGCRAQADAVCHALPAIVLGLASLALSVLATKHRYPWYHERGGQRMSGPVTVCHRGASALAPENSLP